MSAAFSSRLPLARKLLLLVLVPCLLQAFFVGILAIVILSANKELEQIEHQRDALVALKETAGVGVVALMNIRDNHRISSAAAREELHKVNRAFHGDSGDVTGLDMASFPELKEIIEDAESMKGEIETLLLQAQKNIDATRNGRKIKRTRLVERALLASTILNFQSIAKRIVAAEASLKLTDVEKINSIQKTLNFAIFTVLGINAIITVGFVFLFTQDIAKRLKLVADNTHKLAQSDQTLVACPGTDEIAAINAALHDAASKLKDFRRQELAILDNALEVIFTLDEKLKLSAVNKSSQAGWGLPADQLLGRNFLSLLAPECREVTRLQIESMTEDAESPLEKRVEATIAHSDLVRPRTFEITFTKREGRLTGVARDITQEKAVAALKERLLAIVNHDLRTPLASLSITISVITQSNKIADPHLNKELESIDAEVQEVMELTHNLLSLEKQESELANIDFQPVKLYNIWLRVKPVLQPLCKERSISLIGPSRDVEVLANEDKLVQSISVMAKTLVPLAADDSQISFAIEDKESNGQIRLIAGKLAADSGSAQSLQERLSNLCDENTFDNENISLSIARAIIKRHRGQISFQVEETAGFAIAVTIPAAVGVC